MRYAAGVFWNRDPQTWMALGRHLGLTPYHPTAGFTFGASFRQLKRSLGAPAYAPPQWKYWLCGQRRNLEVIVLLYTTGSGSHTTHWTGAVARIDPPLFLGLDVKRQGWLQLIPVPDVILGHPLADQAFLFSGFDPARIRQLFSPSDPQGMELLNRMCALPKAHSLLISDSVVAISVTGTVTDPSAVLGMLDPAIDLADMLARRRRQMADSAGELAQQGQWRSFADLHGWSFDSYRMKLAGARDRIPMELALETDRSRVFVAATTRFPQPVAVAFSAIPTCLPNFMQGIFSQDIEIGDPAFDAAYKVTGHPVEAVQAALARPGLLGVLKHLAARTPEVHLSHQHLFFRLPGACPLMSDVELVVQLGSTVGRELFGQMQGMGPYR